MNRNLDWGLPDISLIMQIILLILFAVMVFCIAIRLSLSRQANNPSFVGNRWWFPSFRQGIMLLFAAFLMVLATHPIGILYWVTLLIWNITLFICLRRFFNARRDAIVQRIRAEAERLSHGEK